MKLGPPDLHTTINSRHSIIILSGWFDLYRLPHSSSVVWTSKVSPPYPPIYLSLWQANSMLTSLPAMTDQDTSYRPRSPDFSSLQSPFPQSVNNSPYQVTSPLAHRVSYDASPFFAPQYQHPVTPSARVPQQYIPPFTDPNFDPDMARRSSRLAQAAYAAPAQESKYIEPADPEPMEPEPEEYEEHEEPEEPAKPTPGAGIEVKTKFPVARIKRIMQADEDVGKVAQVTPIAVCRYSRSVLIRSRIY